MTVIHVNVPYSMLTHRIDFVIKHRINPEIYFNANDLDTCNETEVQRLAHSLQQNDLEVSIHGPFMDLSPGGVDPRVKEVTQDRFSTTLELARFFKPTTIVFHPGYEERAFDGAVDLWLASSLKTWKPLVKKAEEMGLILAIENVYEEGPDSLRQLLSEIHSPHFRFCFDTGHHHSFSQRKVPLAKWMESLGGYLGEVHLHDNHTESDQHLPMGEGGFDFNQFFNLLSHYRLKPIYTLEPHQEDHLWRGLEAAHKYISAKSKAPNDK